MKRSLANLLKELEQIRSTLTVHIDVSSLYLGIGRCLSPKGWGLCHNKIYLIPLRVWSILKLPPPPFVGGQFSTVSTGVNNS